MADRRTYLDLLSSGKMVNVYQPVVDLRSGRVVGFETLGRLAAESGLVMPGTFLPHFNQKALTSLFFQSLQKVVLLIRDNQTLGFPYWASINISVLTLSENDFIDRITSLMEQLDVEPKVITLEVLESGEVFDIEFVRNILQQLRKIGFSVAIDDIGTGFSSLSRLRDLPIDKIKLDRSFVLKIGERPDSLHFIAAMQTLARGLGQMLICEGIETDSVLEAVTILGVEAAQGYVIAKPMQVEPLKLWLKQHNAQVRDMAIRSLLGAYATHIKVMDVFIALRNQAIPIHLLPEASNPHMCSVGRYLDERDMHQSAVGVAHRKFHSLIEKYKTDPEAWDAASTTFLSRMEDAIIAERQSTNFK